MTITAEMPLNIDSTMMVCARSCLEKFRLEFVLGLRPPGISIDLHAGACFATAIEAYRKAIFVKGMTEAQALDFALVCFSLEWKDFQIPDFKKTAKTFENMCEAVESYFKTYPARTDHIQPYYLSGKPTLEFTFAIPLEPCAFYDTTTGYSSHDPNRHAGLFPLHPSGDPWLWSGRFDMLGTYSGRPCVEDDKTTGRSISTGWADQWNLRNQFLGYVWACQQVNIKQGENVLNTVAVRGVAIQKTQIGHAEAIKVYPQYLIERWHEQLRRDLWRIRAAWDSGYFDLNLGDTCTSYGVCPYMNICSSTPEMRESWFNDFVSHRWNPLHKNPVNNDPTIITP